MPYLICLDLQLGQIGSSILENVVSESVYSSETAPSERLPTNWRTLVAAVAGFLAKTAKFLINSVMALPSLLVESNRILSRERGQ